MIFANAHNTGEPNGGHGTATTAVPACSPTPGAGAPASAAATPLPNPATTIAPATITDIRRISISFHNLSSPPSYPLSAIPRTTDAVPTPHTR